MASMDIVLTLRQATVYIGQVMNDEPEIGPVNGSLVIVGGGSLADPTILRRFVALAGGPSAPIAVIPTAQERDPLGPASGYLEALIAAGALNLTLLHTRDRAVAGSEAFVQPLQKARGVWFSGGRQWRLADAYLHTATHAAVRAVLDRGGVVGGSSAGATILGSYLVRGDTSGNEIMMGDHQEGFGFLRNVAIDQHLLKRNRQFDLLGVVETHPELLGIGIDESTAIVVHRDEFEVIGKSYVAIYDPKRVENASGRFYLLAAGDRFNLKTREATRPTQKSEALAPFAGETAPNPTGT